MLRVELHFTNTVEARVFMGIAVVYTRRNEEE